MLSEKDIYIEQYLSFTFNGGSAIYFDNYEVRGNVEYVPATTPEIFTSESGIVTSINKPQREYFKFTIRYETPSTRRKINTIFQAIQSAYTLSFSFPHFIAPFSTFPPVDTFIPLTENFKHTASFSSAIIEFPKDFAFDRIGRGQGTERIQDIEIKVYRSAAFDIPLEPCAAMNAKSTTQLFNIQPWILNGSGELQYVLVEPKTSEITVTNWPTGVLYLNSVLTGMKSLMNPVGMVGNAQKYVPDTTTVISGSTYYFAINFIPVTISTGESCTVTTFSQEYGTPLGDYGADYNNDYN